MKSWKKNSQVTQISFILLSSCRECPPHEASNKKQNISNPSSKTASQPSSLDPLIAYYRDHCERMSPLIHEFPELYRKLNQAKQDEKLQEKWDSLKRSWTVIDPDPTLQEEHLQPFVDDRNQIIAELAKLTNSPEDEVARVQILEMLASQQKDRDQIKDYFRNQKTSLHQKIVKMKQLLEGQ